MLRWEERDGRVGHRAKVAKAPDFADDLVPGGFRDNLLAVTGVRRLLHVVTVERTSECVAVLDRRDKTVVRVYLERGIATTGARRRRLPLWGRVEGLLGYDSAFAALTRFLESALGLERQDSTEFELALAVTGVVPANQTTLADLTLDPRERADCATRRVLAVLFGTLQANEDGVRRDLDTEFLHDFRVAVRRTRACLGQLRPVLGDQLASRFTTEFGWLGSLTGPTRDLDVYLLNLVGYTAELSDSVRPDLRPLREHLTRRRQAAWDDLLEGLASSRYQRLIRAWRRVVLSGDDTNGTEAARPIRVVAATRIRRAYKRVRRRGRALETATSAESIHELRIACKKLRYLLEFFRSLFDDGPGGEIIRALKRLQDDLGEFNDLEIQQDELQESARVLLHDGRVSASVLLTMGRLTERLQLRQHVVRRRLGEGVSGFVNRRTASIIEGLLTTGDRLGRRVTSSR
ncbi:MAG: CHAD domain-containing protein [Acidobacteriota bacterium]|nr:CHAD domain-containing protein [Acidobacteriota bacterium]